MSNKKKIFIVVYIVILAIISTMLINKISATGSVTEDGEGWISLSWGHYQVTEEGTTTDPNYPQVIGKGYKDKAAVDQQLSTSRFYFKTNGNKNNSEYYNWSVFCIQKGTKLINESQDTTSTTTATDIEEHDGGSAEKILIKNADGTTEPLKINGKEVSVSDATNTLTANEVSALDPTVSSATTGSNYIRGTKKDEYDTTKTYVSKGIKGADGKIHAGKSTLYATKLPDGETEIKFSNNQTFTRDSNTQDLPWAEAFVFANVSKEDQAKAVEKTDAQRAIWTLKRDGSLNTGNSDNFTGELVTKAKLFEKYKKEQEKRESNKPKLVEENQDQYKYKFVINGNYLIAGPVKVEYGPLKVKDGNTELEVGKIEGLIVYGLRGDNNELIDITEHIKFTDKNGNELSGDKVEKTDTDKEYSFPKSGQEFYIRLDYDKMKSLGNVKAINSIEVKFKELDVRAVGAKIEDVKTYETEWYASNVIFQNCTTNETGGGSGGGEYTKPKIPCYYTNNYMVWVTIEGMAIQAWHPDYVPILGNWDEIYGSSGLRSSSNGFSDEIRNSSSLDSSSNVLRSGFTTTHLKNNCTSANATHTDNDSESYGVLIKGKVNSTGSDEQNLFVLFTAEMYWRKYKLVILFGPENTPDDNTPDTPKTPTSNPPTTWAPWTSMPPPTTWTPWVPSSPPGTGITTTPVTESPSDSHPTYIDIGGKVWVDDVDSKQGSQDGTDSEYGTGTDYPRQNVKVTLYDENGKVVEKDLVAEYARNDFKNPTWTDSDGNYVFKQLSMDHKYYVEFTYDGMTYETVDLLKGETPNAYMKDPNNTNYDNTSKAKEDQTKRTEFNTRFTEIQGNGLASGGYTSGKTANGDILKYKSTDFTVNEETRFQSRLLTTTEEKDVERLWNKNDNDREKGISRRASDSQYERDYDEKETYEMSVNTKDSGLATFPFGEKEYVIYSAQNKLVNEFNYLQHINLGLKRRTRADLSLVVDIKAGGTAIKDKTKYVPFKSNVPEGELKAEIGEDQIDSMLIDKKWKGYTEGTITQDIAGTDYYWYANLGDIYDNNPYSGTEKENSLNVYVLYKIIIGNQSKLDTTNATVTSLVDYFSQGLTVPTETGDTDKINKIFGKFLPKGITLQNEQYSWVDGGDIVNWESAGTTTGNGETFNTMKTKDLNLNLGDAGNTKTIYLVLKVKENDKLLSTNELKNITEIASYKIHDRSGNALGLVDWDSAPNNATPGSTSTYEDDTDDAPVFQLSINYNLKTIEGDVWEDSDNPLIDGTKIDKVKVELIEYVYKNGEIVEVPRPGLTETTNEKGERIIGVKRELTDRTVNGHYKFLVEGGNYAVKFTYGDEEMLKTKKQYNAQDYQASKPKYEPLSKIYTKDFNMAKATTSDLKDYLGKQALVEVTDEINARTKNAQQDWETTNWNDTTPNTKSNARDLVEDRIRTIENAIDLTNEKATLLDKLGDKYTESLTDKERKELEKYTKMEAVSDIVIMESNDLAQRKKIVNLALKERPKSSLQLKKDVSRIVVRTNDGVALIDTNDSSKMSNVQQLREIQDTFINMDAISMDGATIDIDYTITVTNNGAPDKLSNYQYLGEDRKNLPVNAKYTVDRGENFGDLINTLNTYFGKGAIKDEEAELPTKANVIYDYVNINLEFRADDNKDGDIPRWVKVYDEDTDLKFEHQEWLTTEVRDRVVKTERKVSKVIQTTGNAENVIKNLLTSGENQKATIPVHLGITLAENTVGDYEDAFAYSNCAEIIQVYSGPGRRDYEAVVGNYVPYSNEPEGDSSITGTSVITPPLGEGRIYYVIAIVSATIVIAGIIIIKKKVLKK